MEGSTRSRSLDSDRETETAVRASASSRTIRKAEAAVYRRQAQDEPARSLFFNLLIGWACDLEPMVAAAGQRKAEGARPARKSG
ncbi:hypothetical protein [Bacillus sp. PK3_68]|uniref:hypothetical protein n=1 Tax=Bacillus sp. PK3_68 TaxID=2027408 RepID=UPI000E744825|nr:hypothetical protein [Bacillus sp. PK3_68]RJS59955.1 hypothetical protein CJ483_07590 [Bacillus sp. PK3_68]